MTKVIRLIQTYLIYGLVPMLICMAWGTMSSEREITSNPSWLVRASWEVLSWNLILWFFVLTIFMVLLVVSSETREKTLKRLANLKERDEREQQITGVAARTAYVSTMSLLIAMLFFSMFTLNIEKHPKPLGAEGNNGVLRIEMNAKLLDDPVEKTDAKGNILFETRGIPLSKPAIILFLLVWQLAAFNIKAKRESAL